MKLACMITLIAAAAIAATPVHARRETSILGCYHRSVWHGHNALDFCGSARASVRLGTLSAHYSPGSCVQAAGRFAVNLGISVTSIGPAPNWLQVWTVTKPHSGKQIASISIVLGGKNYAVSSSFLTLAPGMKGGTFSGLTGSPSNPADLLNPTTKLAGSFTC